MFNYSAYRITLMRVLHITPTYRPTLGGIEAVVENLCQALVARGVTAHVVHIAPDQTESHEFYLGR